MKIIIFAIVATLLFTALALEVAGILIGCAIKRERL